MHQITGELFEQLADAHCITTNASINRQGLAVMGRGCALQAAQADPALRRDFAELIRANGNVTQVLREGPPALVALPVKHAWMQTADLTLIRASLRALVALADQRGWQHVVLPRPGCGNGRLRWAEDVEKTCSRILDDRFSVITFPPRMVLNKRTHDCTDAVYIGRGSIWGNPFVIGEHGTRRQVIEQFRSYLWAELHTEGSAITRDALAALHGRKLACYCAPNACHGDVLVKAAAWAAQQAHA